MALVTNYLHVVLHPNLEMGAVPEMRDNLHAAVIVERIAPYTARTLPEMWIVIEGISISMKRL